MDIFERKNNAFFRFVAFWFENKVGWQPHCVEGIIHVWSMSLNHPFMEYVFKQYHCVIGALRKCLHL